MEIFKPLLLFGNANNPPRAHTLEDLLRDRCPGTIIGFAPVKVLNHELLGTDEFG